MSVSHRYACALMLALAACARLASAAPASLQARVERLEAIAQVQNVMSRHGWYYAAGQHARELDELWSRKEPDISWGSDEGYWIGRALLDEYYVRYFDTFRARDLHEFARRHPEVADEPANYGSGTSMFHTNSTPVIEIAGDGRTAKGMWYSIGQVTQTPGGVQTPTYMWERYAVDFVREGGVWRIWHFFVHTDWSAAPGASWARDGSAGGPPPFPGGGQAGESGAAPEPTVRAASSVQARPYAPPADFPRAPLPYRTFAETFSYGAPKR